MQANKVEQVPERPRGRLSNYRQWQEGEEIPRYTGSYVTDLATLEVAPWARTGQKGAFVNLAAQEIDDGHLLEIAPSGQTEVLHHVYESLIYVVDGRGATTFWQTPGGPKRTVEWQRGSLFSPPLNCYYQHFNLAGDQPARLYAATTAPAMINLLGDNDFIFNSPHQFTSRFNLEEDYFSNPGTHTARTEWSTNFVPDLRSFELDPYPERGAGGVNMHFTIAGNAARAHISEFPTGTYKNAHCHGTGAHVIILGGEGFSLLWFEGEERKKIDWANGSLLSPQHGEYHQHFNAGPNSARYLAFTFSQAVIVSERVSHQIEYRDEDPDVYALYEEECAKRGAKVVLPRPEYATA